MFERVTPIKDPVSLRIDRREFTAERGEPIAIALLAAGETALARSPKLHRPRAPACLRGDCDGCLLRLNGAPNVMTCLQPARGGEEVSTQNVLGSRKTDLLRLTDWFFPRGIDHHHLLAGVPAAGTLMQTFARQMAGIGRLPEAAEPPQAARAIAADVLIVGAGLAGVACAAALAARGAWQVAVVEDGAVVGGSAAWGAPQALRERREQAIAGATVLTGSTVVGLYDGRALVATPEGAAIVAPRFTLVATGAHDGALLAEGNDLPGVMSARAVCCLAARGILPRRGALVVGAGPWAERAEQSLGERIRGRVSEGEIAAVRGSGNVTRVVLKSGATIDCGVVAVDLPQAPAFELAVQAGATTRASAGGFAVVVDDDGRAGPTLFAAGENTGLAFDPDGLIESGERAARAIERALQSGP